MTILSDRDILARMKEAGGLGIEHFVEANLTPNGYDCTIAEVALPSEHVHARDGQITVPPGRHFLVSTHEYFRLPPALCASIWIKTSWARKGVLAAFGKIDAGFEGTLTLAAFNASAEPLVVPIGKKFAQIIFEELSSVPLKAYAERSGNFQGQRGVTIEPRKAP
jgi:dCTP deaminase